MTGPSTNQEAEFVPRDIQDGAESNFNERIAHGSIVCPPITPLLKFKTQCNLCKRISLPRTVQTAFLKYLPV